MRLDKYLADCGVGSRKEVKKIISDGRVTVGEAVVTDVGMQVSEDVGVSVDGALVTYKKYSYVMMNKPAGVLTATQDYRDKTVLDLIKPPIPRELSPVGRLDKDTVGLLLLTNDGKLAHRLLSPKSHIPKTYYVQVTGDRVPDDSDVDAFKNGLELSDHTCLPAELSIVSDTELRITIYEGKFHQVKRMCAARGFKVTYLRRESMGSLKLDPALAEGDYRDLTASELSHFL